MNDQDYRNKIRKLLALAGSSNENEAKAALLKARKLMAEHKIMEAEIKDTQEKSVKRILTTITCSKRREPWIIKLSGVIAEGYCCKAYRNRIKGKQTFTVGFIGIEEDVEICANIFDYAVACVRTKNEHVTDEYGFNSAYVKYLSDSYGFGFACGLLAAFRKQQKDKSNEWGLIMVMPNAVVEAASQIPAKVFHSHAEEQIDRSAYAEGYRDGEKFNSTKRLKERRA